MGLTTPIADLFFFENNYQPIIGDVGFIGRQTTYLTEKAFNLLVERYAVAKPQNFHLSFDSETGAAKAEFAHLNLISDRSFINLFGGRYLAIDISPYEGADVIADMSSPIHDDLFSRFDFIFDGSCLDNIFNPAEAIMNISKMLRPGGRVMLCNHATHFNAPYTCFSPGWFFDYFVANKYDDCKIYVLLFKTNHELHFGPYNTFVYNWQCHHVGMIPPLPEGFHALLTVIAEKWA